MFGSERTSRFRSEEIFPCSSEYRRESTLYPSCIPSTCGAWQYQLQVPMRLVTLALQLCTNEDSGDHPVFCSLDLASSLKVADGMVIKVAVEQLVEARAIVREVAENILQLIESKSKVAG